MKKLVLALGLLLGLSAPALAQNTTCATRATGDSTNACASTAFVNNEIAAATIQPGQIPLTQYHFLIGNSLNKAADTALGGDCTYTTTYGIVCTKTNNVSFGYFATGTDAGNLTGTVTVPHGGTGLGSFTANLPILGNGTSALAQGTRSGNTTEFGTVSGALVSGNCIKADASGNLVDAATICGPDTTTFVYANKYMACDGTTNDTTNFLNALKAAANKTLVFPGGGVICLINATVINGTNADVPKWIIGNGATLRAQSSNSTGYLLTIENPYANIGPSGINGANFVMQGLVIDGNDLYGYPLYFHGGQSALVQDILVLRGVHNACTFTGEPGFGLYNNTFIRVDCGDGYLGATYASAGHCVVENSINNTGTNYNNNNTFIGLEADWCGGNGINIDYANNAHVGYDVEANVGTGIVISHSTAATFTHGFVECNNAGNTFRSIINCPSPPGTAFSGTANSAGVDVIGGTIVGAASGLSYTRNDLLLAPAFRTFGAAASCGAGACVGSP